MSAKNKHKRGKREGLLCSHCGVLGHTVDRCFKIHGYPPGFKAKSKNSSTSHDMMSQASEASKSCSSSSDMTSSLTAKQCQQLVSLLSNMDSPNTQIQDSTNPQETTVPTFSTSCWILDSGATHHICNSHDLFQKLSLSRNYFLTLPTSQNIPIQGVGSVVLFPNLVLSNVFYVPSFRFNLLSLGSLLQSYPYHVIFSASSFTIQDKISSMKIAKGELEDGLYILNMSHTSNFSSVNSSSNAVSNSVSHSVWHARLGHLSNKMFVSLNNKYHLTCSKLSSLPCDICPMVEQHRLSFVANNNFCDVPFDLIHCDICGPYYEPTYAGQRFFLTLVDDNSRFTWTYLMQHKSEAPKIIMEFFNFVKVQFGATIKAFRYDNAEELALADFLTSKGVIHQFSCVERPQHNSVIEQNHQRLLKVATSLLFQSRVPLSFWGHCLVTATFIINRIVSPSLKNSSPYEVLFHKSPDYAALRVFGCLCYASTSPSHQDKFTERDIPAVFVGYHPNDYKRYKVYDLTKKTFFISTDVQFHENTFPFHLIHPYFTSPDPFSNAITQKPQPDFIRTSPEIPPTQNFQPPFVSLR